jgi:uridine phosphorylase
VKPHIRLEADERFARVLTCGPPERAHAIAEHLEGVKAIARNREYHSFLGKYRGHDVLVISHGVGAPGATICFQELIDVGAKAIVRMGTAGGLQDSSCIGDVVVASGAIRKDGVTSQMVPLGFPALPDAGLSARIRDRLRVGSVRHTSGIVLTTDLFYPSLLDPEWSLFQKAGAVAVEMECSALFVTGLLRKIKTAGVLVLDGNPLRWKDGDYAPSSPKLVESFNRIMPLCLQALVDGSASPCDDEGAA